MLDWNLERGNKWSERDINRSRLSISYMKWWDSNTPGLTIQVGREIWFKFVVTNNGDVGLKKITLSDNVLDLTGVKIPKSLGSGDFFIVEIGSFAEEGSHTNIATATGEFRKDIYQDTDPANYLGVVI